ncbi:unnamed protein product [Rotaria sordida]|uniref:Uncharacterized protein n=1 Tax=Rotaria sordida TaxID=392033 RepID=A0A815HTR0_9BILA|nr:unnamed protein product [Rotaria sordida]
MILVKLDDQNTTLKNAPSILSKIITISESTLVYRRRLRTIYRDYQNEQRTVKQIQSGRSNYVLLDKSLIPYTNGNSVKYPYQIQYQQQFLSSHHLFHRPQSSQRTNHQRIVDEDQRNTQE